MALKAQVRFKVPPPVQNQDNQLIAALRWLIRCYLAPMWISWTQPVFCYQSFSGINVSTVRQPGAGGQVKQTGCQKPPSTGCREDRGFVCLTWERMPQKLAALPGGISGHKATDSSPVSHFTVSQSPKTRPLPFFPSRESSLTHPLALCVV